MLQNKCSIDRRSRVINVCTGRGGAERGRGLAEIIERIVIVIVGRDREFGFDLLLVVVVVVASFVRVRVGSTMRFDQSVESERGRELFR